MTFFCLWLTKLLDISTFAEESFDRKRTGMVTENITSEGENFTLACKYDGNVQNLQWYRQYPESSPEYVLLVFEATDDFQAVILWNKDGLYQR